MIRQATRAGVAALAIAVILSAAWMGGCAQSPATTAPAAGAMNADSLYARLGGETGIRQLADGWVTRVTEDQRINEHFAKANPADLKTKLTAQLGEITGGPQIYIGKDMKTAHQGMNVTDADWKAFLEDLKGAMNAQKVPALEQEELLVKIEPMKNDIVGQ